MISYVQTVVELCFIPGTEKFVEWFANCRLDEMAVNEMQNYVFCYGKVP